MLKLYSWHYRAIDANHPVMAAINGGTHQVMITGYNNNKGNFAYFDPAAGTYYSLPYSGFSGLVEITSKKIKLYR